MAEAFSFQTGNPAIENCGIQAHICEKLIKISADMPFSIKSHPENAEHIDIIHMGIPIGMPEAQNNTASTLVDQAERFIKLIEELRNILTDPQGKYSKNPKFKIFQILAKSNPDPLEPFITPHWIAAQGNISVEDFLINCAINKRFGSQIFYHTNPEEFPAMVHFYNQQIFYTQNEAECLDFFFHHPEYLEKQFLDVPPYCLRYRDNMKLTEAWMDLIKVQILQGFGNKITSETQAAFDKMAPTGQKIQDLKNNFESLKILERSGSGTQHKNKKINEIYEKHSKSYLGSPQPYYNNILGFLLHKASNMINGTGTKQNKPSNKM